MLYTTRSGSQYGDILDICNIRRVIFKYIISVDSYERKYPILEGYILSIPDDILNYSIFNCVIEHSHHDYDTSAASLKLLQSKLNLNAEQLSESLLISSCCYYGYGPIARCLLQMGADANFGKVIERQRNNTYSQLCYAYYTTHISTLTALVEYGLDVEKAMAYHASAIVRCQLNGNDTEKHKLALEHLSTFE